MEKLKVKVSSEAESKEAQRLFSELGYEMGTCSIGFYPAVIITTKAWSTGNWCSTRAIGLNNPAHENHKEITLQELRDMVVLKCESLNDKIATAEVARQNEKHSHYKKDVSHLNVIDVYRVLELYGVESHAVGHAIKKLLCCGQRGAKGRKQDIQEAIDSLNRELEMVTEDEL